MFPPQITKFWNMLRYIWRDKRVPMLARIFVIVAPLYWLNPYDLIPDLQPGGYCDDAIIFCLLIVMAFRLVPKEVFQDSRKAAYFGKRVATLGMLYVSLVGTTVWLPHTALNSRRTASTAVGTCLSLPNAIASRPHVKPGSASAVQGDGALADRGDGFHAANCSAGTVMVNPSPQIEKSTDHRHKSGLRFSGQGPPAFLATRGGQHQLYASEDDSAADAAAAVAYSSLTPTRFAGGFFVGSRVKSLSFGADL